jgi:hypothetical protein
MSKHYNIGKNNPMYGKKQWNYGIKIDKNKYSNFGMVGKKHSNEAKVKMSICHKGKKLTEEHKLKLSISKLGRKRTEYEKISMRKPKSEESRINESKRVKEEYKLGKRISPFKELRKYQIFPKVDTSIEIKIQEFLKELKIGFFTHVYMDEILNSYQCDIFVPVQRNKYRLIRQPIIIECDGDYWHNYPIGKDIDNIRTKQLESKGFRVIRLWENNIKQMNLNKFKEMILCQKYTILLQ